MKPNLFIVWPMFDIAMTMKLTKNPRSNWIAFAMKCADLLMEQKGEDFPDLPEADEIIEHILYFDASPFGPIPYLGPIDKNQLPAIVKEALIRFSDLSADLAGGFDPTDWLIAA